MASILMIAPVDEQLVCSTSSTTHSAKASAVLELRSTFILWSCLEGTKLWNEKKKFEIKKKKEVDEEI